MILPFPFVTNWTVRLFLHLASLYFLVMLQQIIIFYQLFYKLFPGFIDCLVYEMSENTEKAPSQICATNSPKSTDTRFTIIEGLEDHQIYRCERLESINVWHFV